VDASSGNQESPSIGINHDARGQVREFFIKHLFAIREATNLKETVPTWRPEPSEGTYVARIENQDYVGFWEEGDGINLITARPRKGA
jgi:hypothetical protein